MDTTSFNLLPALQQRGSQLAPPEHKSAPVKNFFPAKSRSDPGLNVVPSRPYTSSYRGSLKDKDPDTTSPPNKPKHSIHLQPIDERVDVPNITYSIPTARARSPVPAASVHVVQFPLSIPSRPTNTRHVIGALPTSKGAKKREDDGEVEDILGALGSSFALSTTKKAVHSKSSGSVHTSYNLQAIVPKKKNDRDGSKTERGDEDGLRSSSRLPARKPIPAIHSSATSTDSSPSIELSTTTEESLPSNTPSSPVSISPTEPKSNPGPPVKERSLSPTKHTSTIQDFNHISPSQPDSSTLTVTVSASPQPQKELLSLTPVRTKSSSCPPRVEMPEEILMRIRDHKSKDPDSDANGNGEVNYESEGDTDEGEGDGYYNTYPNNKQKDQASDANSKVLQLDTNTSPTSTQFVKSNPSTSISAPTSAPIPTEAPISAEVLELADSPTMAQLPKTKSKKKHPKLPLVIPVLHRAKSKTFSLDGDLSPCSARVTESPFVKKKKLLENNHFIEFEVGASKPLQEDSDSLTVEEVNTLINCIANDMQLVRMGFFYEVVAVLVKKRMQLALTQVTSDLAALKSAQNIEISNRLQHFLSDDGLVRKLSVLTSAIQAKQERGLPVAGKVLSDDEIQIVFPYTSSEIYLQLESLVCKILNNEIKCLLQDIFKPFVGQSLKAFLNYLSERILKGKVIQYAHRVLEGHYTEKELSNLTLAITHPAFTCQSKEAVWWSADDQKIGWLDNFANISEDLLERWTRQIDQEFFFGQLSNSCMVCKQVKLKFFESIKCPTCRNTEEHFYCKQRCLYTHMSTAHTVFIASANAAKNRFCEICNKSHELYKCKKCAKVIDSHGENKVILMHELACHRSKVE